MEEVLNPYELKNRRKRLLGELGKPSNIGEGKNNKEKMKATAEGLGRDLLLGVVGGGVAGAILGRYSFLLGLGVAGFGHYSESKAFTALGLGMMASGTFQALTGKEQDPNKPVMEKVTERVQAFKSELKRKLWIDKFYENKEKEKEKLADNNLNGVTTDSKSKSAGKAKEKNSDEISELSPEEQSILEKEIENAVDQKIDEFIIEKKSKSKAGQTSSEKKQSRQQEQKPSETDFSDEDSEDYEDNETSENLNGNSHPYKTGKESVREFSEFEDIGRII